ncbi:hypothetical protein LB465_11895 [Salegentibacter sp. LM13S]|uniref:hypothetical protein n=1 Tax=Salegentibacter lacus TaxID=2873599 RepID=UPI001CC96ECC|nr:hypothetical protein [Salegentibacter lacus]MBZ9631483.1 hypothetical protein [Salegentibacter lacus]
MLYNQPPDNQDKSIWEIIKNDKSILIVHLKRENLLASYASLKIGHKTGIWKENILKDDGDTNHRNNLIDLKPKDCESYFSLITDYWENISNIYSSHPYIEIFYEDLVNDKQETLNEVFKAMYLETYEVSSKMKKQNRESLEDLIENYGELKTYFKRTKWHYLFKNSHP